MLPTTNIFYLSPMCCKVLRRMHKQSQNWSGVEYPLKNSNIRNNSISNTFVPCLISSYRKQNNDIGLKKSLFFKDELHCTSRVDQQKDLTQKRVTWENWVKVLHKTVKNKWIFGWFCAISAVWAVISLVFFVPKVRHILIPNPKMAKIE